MNYKRTAAMLNRQFMNYLFPTIMGSVAILLSAFIDGILASAFCGNDAFSAVNVGEPVILFMQAVFFLFGIGASVRISVALGRREQERANTLFSLAFFLSIASSVVIGVLGIVFIDPIVSVMCNNQTLEALVREYTLVNFCGAPLLIFVPMMSYIIRTDGMPRLSANILIFANIMNLIMDVIFMKFLHMGIAGAALATVSGYFLGLILMIWYLKSPRRTLKLHFPKGSEWKEWKSLCSGGLASVLNTVLLFTKGILLNRIVLSVGGENAMAVFSVCNFSVSFVSMFIGGGSDTMTPILGMLYGEKDRNGMSYVFRRTITVVLISCAAVIAFMMIFPNVLLALFNINDPAKVQMGMPAIRIFALSLFGLGISYTLMNYYQTISRKSLAMLISALRGLVITVPAAYLLSNGLGITGIWTAFPVAEYLNVILTVIVSLFIAAGSRGKYKGILLRETEPEGDAVMDLTLKADQAAASEVSKTLQDFCMENGEYEKTANFTGVLAEEMIENIRTYNLNAPGKKAGKKGAPDVDLVCRLMGEEMLLLVRDNGRTLSSVETDEESDEFTNLKMIHSIAKSVDYTRALGLNSTVVTLARERTDAV